MSGAASPRYVMLCDEHGCSSVYATNETEIPEARRLLRGLPPRQRWMFWDGKDFCPVHFKTRDMLIAMCADA